MTTYDSTADALFIPDQVLEELVEDANRHVLESLYTRPRPPIRLMPPDLPLPARSLREEWLALLAGMAGLTCWGVLVGVWSAMAVQTPTAAWVTIAVAGWVALVPVVAGVLHLRTLVWRARTARSTAIHARVARGLAVTAPAHAPVGLLLQGDAR